MKSLTRPSNCTLALLTLWAAAFVSTNYVVIEIAGWITLGGVCVAANFKPAEGTR